MKNHLVFFSFPTKHCPSVQDVLQPPIQRTVHPLLLTPRDGDLTLPSDLWTVTTLGTAFLEFSCLSSIAFHAWSYSNPWYHSPSSPSLGLRGMEGSERFPRERRLQSDSLQKESDSCEEGRALKEAEAQSPLLPRNKKAGANSKSWKTFNVAGILVLEDRWEERRFQWINLERRICKALVATLREFGFCPKNMVCFRQRSDLIYILWRPSWLLPEEWIGWG